MSLSRFLVPQPYSLAKLAPRRRGGRRSPLAASRRPGLAAAQLHRLDPAAEAELLDQAGLAGARLETHRAGGKELLLVEDEGGARAGDHAAHVAAQLAGALLVEGRQLGRADQGDRAAVEVALVEEAGPAAGLQLFGGTQAGKHDDRRVRVARGRGATAQRQGGDEGEGGGGELLHGDLPRRGE